MNWWSGTVTLRAAVKMACPLGIPCPYDHDFVVEQTAQTPLSPKDEKEIRAKLQQQLDLIVQKFLEAHK